MSAGEPYFWAKTTAGGQPGISVRDHCLNVGCVAEALIAALPQPLRELLPPGAATLAALHDVGKISPGFQQKCPRWKPCLPVPLDLYEPDHARLSQWFLQSWPPSDRRRLRRWFMAIGAHHGQSKGDWLQRGVGLRGNPGEGEWSKAREAIADELRRFFRPQDGSPDWPDAPPPSESWEACLGFFAGLVTMADWVGSDERFFSPAVESPQLSRSQRREKAVRALAAIGCACPRSLGEAEFARLFPQTPSPNSLQAALANLALTPGLYIIEGPMGCGKTEAALLAAARLMRAGHARGLYFGLPTQTTSNRLYERVEAFLRNFLLSPATLRLTHAASWLRGDDVIRVRPALPSARGGDEDEDAATGWAARRWFTSMRRALLAPFGVGTVDQALLGVVAARHFFIRQFGLAGKVVVLDEVHSYDLYTSTLVDELVADLLRLRCTVLVLSATLTRERRNQLVDRARRALLELGDPEAFQESPPAASSLLPYPLLSGVTELGESLEFPVVAGPDTRPPVQLHCREFGVEQLAAECGARAEAGQVVLWIRNTVAEAQRSFAASIGTRRLGGPPVVLLHSRFPWFQRDRLERLWLRRLGIGVVKRWQRRFARRAADRFPERKGAVIVATQVVEQSVDIDADFLVTDLAPTDMLLQRLGRLWRHQRGPRPRPGPEAWIHAPDCAGMTDRAEIMARLKGLAPPYEAYVLLRSRQEWAERRTIRLPGDIREILEATYAPCGDEPSAWRRLREHLERRKAKFIGKALGASNRWSLPALNDDEGVQTRLNELPSIALVLVRSLEGGRGDVRFVPLDGEEVAVSDHEWSHAAAAALHRNHVKIPAWWLRDRERNNPPSLNRYFLGPWAWAAWDGDNLWLNGHKGENSGLKYLPDRGVWCETPDHGTPKPDHRENDDESGD